MNAMGKTFSVYLDLLRFLAAVVIFVHHLAPLTGDYAVLQRYGDDAVMVFFVLSGYVIAYVTSQKETSFREYSASRLARLYSVVIPALLLTVLFDSVGGPYVDSNDSHPLIRMAISLGFLNQMWGVDVRPWSNVPFWSISYEAAYYALFAIVAFARHRAVLIAAWAAIVGPGIILLLPVWYAGVLVYRYRVQVSVPVGWLLFIGAPILYCAYNMIDGRESVMAASNLLFDGSGLHKAKFWLHDYVVCLMVCAHFVGARVVCERWSFGKLAGPIKAASAYTFALYLIHFPLQLMLWSLWPSEAVLWIGSAVVVYAVGRVTEGCKGDLRRLILSLLTRAHQPSTACSPTRMARR